MLYLVYFGFVLGKKRKLEMKQQPTKDMNQPFSGKSWSPAEPSGTSCRHGFHNYSPQLDVKQMNIGFIRQTEQISKEKLPLKIYQHSKTLKTSLRVNSSSTPIKCRIENWTCTYLLHRKSAWVLIPSSKAQPSNFFCPSRHWKT